MPDENQSIGIFSFTLVCGQKKSLRLKTAGLSMD